MRSGRLVAGLSLTCAVACLAPSYDIVDSIGSAGADGEAGESSGGSRGGGSSGGKGGSGGSVSPPTGGDGGENPGTGGSGASGGTDGTGGGSNGGSAGKGGTSSGGSAGKGGSSSGGTSGGSGLGGSAGATAGTTSGGTAGANGGTGGVGGRGGGGGISGGGAGGSSAGKGGTGGGGASGNILFSDDFETGTDGWTPTPSSVWATATDGSTVYAVTGATASTAFRTAAAGELTWTNVRIDARVKVMSFTGSSTAYFAGICARYQSTSSYACFALRSDGRVAFRVNGTNTAPSTPPGGDITEGVWYTVRVVAIGTNITAFINGTEIAAGSRVTSGAPTSGRIALVAPATNAVFDDVVVSVP